ncbi:hypothetical protein P4O66_005411 [Electrophorus voltai]|uniref:Immunoglobulin V-set domain-containing protein n=1 Tax=Electrophorus voltai TaxID=2609070 RepID=A0AAD9E772_9TELE|nr:hypothetical protein P4O66_005411 [Electrophorus voltai]
MSHDQYLKGDLSLTITGVDYAKRTSYTCECDGTDLCDVRLQLEYVHPRVSQSVTEVKRNETVTLPCSQTCSGLVKWTVNHKPHDILAQCDQISCQSKERFHMSHDQYLKGDLSLTITDADYTKKGWYNCKCNGTILCDQTLRVHDFSSNVDVITHHGCVLCRQLSGGVF